MSLRPTPSILVASAVGLALVTTALAPVAGAADRPRSDRETRFERAEIDEAIADAEESSEEYANWQWTKASAGLSTAARPSSPCAPAPEQPLRPRLGDHPRDLRWLGPTGRRCPRADADQRERS
jgi:hypothetical protein